MIIQNRNLQCGNGLSGGLLTKENEMQPTMKLRWRLAKHGEECAAFGPQYRCHFGDDFDHIQGRVLQQWWEEVKTYRPTQITNIANPPYTIKEVSGEWRDIEIAEE